jgi:hypothetical protein
LLLAGGHHDLPPLASLEMNPEGARFGAGFDDERSLHGNDIWTPTAFERAKPASGAPARRPERPA